MNLLISRFQNWHTKPYTISQPNYLSLNRKKVIRDLRNNDSNMIERSKENQTFHNAEKVFNKLPLSIVEKSNYKIFCSMSFSIKIFRSNFFNGKRLTRIMYL